MTFVLVSTVYAVAIGEPSFGVMGPFAVGLALFAMVFAGRSSHNPNLSLHLSSSYAQQSLKAGCPLCVQYCYTNTACGFATDQVLVDPAESCI